MCVLIIISVIVILIVTVIVIVIVIAIVILTIVTIPVIGTWSQVPFCTSEGLTLRPLESSPHVPSYPR